MKIENIKRVQAIADRIQILKHAIGHNQSGQPCFAVKVYGSGSNLYEVDGTSLDNPLAILIKNKMEAELAALELEVESL